MKIPTISAKRLWHWGDLDIKDRYKNGVSLEGNLFSMSACPRAWQQIARLGGAPLHVREQTTELLDMHSVLYAKDKNAAQLRKLVEDWAIDQKLVEYRDLYQISEFDDELDDFRTMEFASLAEAENEADELDVEIKTIRRLVGTPLLNKSHHQPESNLLGFEYALIDWAREHLSNKVLGVYWDEKLDPLAYSAPRAGMFDSKALELTPAPYVPDDEDAFESISEVRWINAKGLEPKDTELAP